MKLKIKQIVISFFLIIIFNLIEYYIIPYNTFGAEVTIDFGVLFISGLLFGPYGTIGAVVGSFLCNLFRGYPSTIVIFSAIISFVVSYLSFKLWYGNIKKDNVTPPKLNSTYNILLFLGIIILTGYLYGILHASMTYLAYPQTPLTYRVLTNRFFLNYVNSSFVFGIIGIWICKRRNLYFIPKKSEKKDNPKIYKILLISLILSLIISAIFSPFIISNHIMILQMFIILLITCAYCRKPNIYEIHNKNIKSIPEEIMDRFLVVTLIIIFSTIIIILNLSFRDFIISLFEIGVNETIILLTILVDIVVLIFFIPAIAVMRYVENKVIEPISSLSEIEKFIKENEKIESEGLMKLYSKYVNQPNEIGTLARSYTELIEHNNNYIENIHKIEGEKKRVETELYIARRIQAANLPTESIENEDFTVYGYSKPAKEVGGDFFDYYMLDDDNLAIVIGDASGKGIPAAILAMITQYTIKQILKHEPDPSTVMYNLNNQLCEHNSESMFITLWLGIYNRKTKKLIFSNGGHNPPLIKENDEYKYLTVDSGIVLGIMEDFEFVNEEITLTNEIISYTDGITDANNENNEMYGEDRLLSFFNEFKSDENPIIQLFKEIDEFKGNKEQFDDMTLVYLRIK